MKNSVPVIKAAGTPFSWGGFFIRASRLAICLLGFGMIASAEPAQPGAAARGKEIYINGVDLDGAQIKCVTGEQVTEVPAAILKCASCHGKDGRGKIEGGVFPSNIRWNELAKPYSLTVSSGRTRPAYSERLLIRAVTMGIDSGGNRLPATMPRYQLSHQQASDLVAYLKELDNEQDPGVSDGAILLGVVLPPESTGGGIGRAVRETLTSVFEALNRQGGVYGRKVLCEFASAPDTNAAAAFDSFLESKQPFALLASYIAGEEREIGALIERRRIPLIEPITLSTGVQPRKARYTFYLSSGIEGQCAALINFAMQRQDVTAGRSLLVVDEWPLEGLLAKSAEAAAVEGASDRIRLVRMTEIGDWPSFLREAEPKAVFWMASAGALQDFLAAAARVQTYPLLLAPSVLAGPRIYQAPAGFAERIFLSFPTSPGDQSTEFRREFRRFAESGHFSEENLATRISALSAARLIIEVLRQAGREVTREKLVDICEQFYELNLGSMRPLSFGPSRRVGTSGAHVVGVDLMNHRLILPGQWVKCDVR